jgi:hypothetical protein
MKKKKITIGEGINIYKGINMMVQAGVSFPTSLGWDLVDTKGNLEPKIKQYEEQRMVEVKKFGIPNPKGGFDITPELMPEFNKAVKILEDKPLTVEIFSKKLKMSYLKDAELPLDFIVCFKPYLEK